MLMLLMMLAHIADEGALPVGRHALRVCVDPTFEFSMQRVEIPTRAFAAELVYGFVGHMAANGFVG